MAFEVTLKSKKRKRAEGSVSRNQELNTSKPTAIFRPQKGGRESTLSIAVAGSVIANALTHDQKSALAGQIARAATVFNVDEIVVYDDLGAKYTPNQTDYHARQDQESGYDGYKDPTSFLYHVLSYLETPPYLRKQLFAYHENLRTAGALPSLDAPHHLKPHEWCQYREGVTLPKAADAHSGKVRHKSQHIATTTVHAGFVAQIPVELPPNTRVTLKFPTAEQTSAFNSRDEHEPIQAEVVDPAAPREEAGYYWGYNVRLARSLSAVFTECEFEGGYDVSLGTSERGISLSEIIPPEFSATELGSQTQLPRNYSHALVLFGGPAGLESAAEADAELEEKGITKSNINELFDYWVNVLPDQGSRTIRTEEALWIALMGLRQWTEAGQI